MDTSRAGTHHRALLALLPWLAAAAHAAVDVNTATEADLDGLRGLGPASTRLILAERQRQPFSGWADLRARVPGLGSRRAQALSGAGLTVNGQPRAAQRGR